jgi:hypothetical protein
MTLNGGMATADSTQNHNASLQAQGRAMIIRTTRTDPRLPLALPTTNGTIGYVTFRLRLLGPDVAVM